MPKLDLPFSRVINYFIQKQPPRGVPSKRCSKKMQQIYRRTPMPKCDFNKIAKQHYWNHISAWVFSCKIAAYFQKIFFLRTPLGGCLRLLEDFLGYSSYLCYEQTNSIIRTPEKWLGTYTTPHQLGKCVLMNVHKCKKGMLYFDRATMKSMFKPLDNL